MNRAEMIPVVKDAIDGWAWTSETPVEEAIVDALIAAMKDDAAVFRVRKNAPETSRRITDVVREGTVQDHILNQFMLDFSGLGIGLTDDDLERLTGRAHQSVSAARNHLVKRGYVTDSGQRRKNRYGNPAVVWLWTGKRVKR